MADPGVFPSPSFNILLIEDEDSHAELIQRAFEDQDPTVRIHHVHSLTEARNFIRTHKPALIIADWRLPDGESMELLSNRDNPAAIPIILMTSQGNEKIAVDALKSGALDYVVKSPESMLDMPHLAQKAIEQWETLTDYTRTQKALFESEAQFRLLAENATDMILRITTNGEILYVSPASKAVLGYTPDEVERPKELLAPSKLEISSVKIENQKISVKILACEYLRLQHLWAYKYVVESKNSPYFGRVDKIYSKHSLNIGNIYSVRFNSDTNNPRIEKVYK